MAIDLYSHRKTIVDAAVRQTFPQAINVLIEPGHKGRVHVRVVSPEFNGLSESQKQDLLWQKLRNTLGPEAQHISLGIAYGTNEHYNENEI